MASAGRLVVFEGGEGTGKSTQLRRLADLLAERGVPHRTLREPGGTLLGSEVRRILLHVEDEIEARAEALLFMASRAQLVAREIRPALERGEWVLLDRFFLSTYAYQIAGRALPEREVRDANRFATGGLVPDLTLLFALPVQEGLARAAGRSATYDRIEATGEAFHARVAEAFASFARPEWQAGHPECGPIVSIDAGGSEQDVATRVQHVVSTHWPGTFPDFTASDHR
ncbi:MAG TPA: dTMP kinase [Gemmatimonadaceae bacterium]